MFRRILAAVAVTAACVAPLVVAPTADASPSAYTRLHSIMRGYDSSWTIVCHNGTVKTMTPWGTGAHPDSLSLCEDGWVNGAAMSTRLKLHVLNDATLNETVYPLGYTGNIGGGTYSAWVTCPSC
jgi:hypothetical protein